MLWGLLLVLLLVLLRGVKGSLLRDYYYLERGRGGRGRGRGRRGRGRGRRGRGRGRGGRGGRGRGGRGRRRWRRRRRRRRSFYYIPSSFFFFSLCFRRDVRHFFAAILGLSVLQGHGVLPSRAAFAVLTSSEAAAAAAAGSIHSFFSFGFGRDVRNSL